MTLLLSILMLWACQRMHRVQWPGLRQGSLRTCCGECLQEAGQDSRQRACMVCVACMLAVRCSYAWTCWTFARLLLVDSEKVGRWDS